MAWALHDNVTAIGEPVTSYSVVAPVNVTDLDSPSSVAGPSVLIMTPNDDVEKASKVEMPVIVDKESDEFVVVHVNPERFNSTPMHSTLVSDCSTARLADSVFCTDVNQQMTEKPAGAIDPTSKQSESNYDDCSTAITAVNPVMLADPSHFDQQVDAMVDKATGVIDPAG